jgi:hypothetical protein
MMTQRRFTADARSRADVKQIQAPSGAAYGLFDADIRHPFSGLSFPVRRAL